MGRFIIEGGYPLQGTVHPSGNKNETLPVLAACLLTDQEVVLDNVPRIQDVEVMCRILADLGASVSWSNGGTVTIKAANIHKTTLDRGQCNKIRASILLAGPMLARFHEVVLPPPGGDVIGRRRVDTHFDAMQALGATLEIKDSYHLKADKLVGTHMFLDEPSVTGTENAVMAAVLAKGTSIIENAACEPHVQALCRMLNSMGAKITGIGTNMLHIEGVDVLGGTRHRIGPDYLEIGSFIGLGAVIGGPKGITIADASAHDLRKIKYVFERLGVQMEFKEDGSCFVPGGQTLKIKSDLHGGIPQIDDAPWPQFPTDLMSIAITVATQASGTVLFFEKMFEGRMFFVDYLVRMGAHIILCDPHRVVVVGKSDLYGANLESPDVRAGMALVIASLVANGTSVINNIRQVDRGYERIDEKLRALGAHIVREED
ncbi:UDP-N-acetylglucosamine 1-carboxyvinyltransferase [Myxococcota bacterium]|jgi:UDP-N-acetylglucosamine 1-carboxyvinyltransferase|nr:UDP-N-acetylglucosamine 1-carboxyvinyltransferase [Myxococcota bacterium]HHW97500.1 UDP-N-acetylglucosamine 1-carboxyvinyltransferase [Oligoflexales bacterium]